MNLSAEAVNREQALFDLLRRGVEALEGIDESLEAIGGILEGINVSLQNIDVHGISCHNIN